jgi:pimeloyl-ACP methyl ester carboxylesterase
MDARLDRLIGADDQVLAYDLLPPAQDDGRPGVIFLHGLASDRRGTKAEALAAHCALRGLGFVRFDMSGHGESSGRFEDTGPSRWRDDALAVLDRLTAGPQVLVGSSMGGWIMLLAALARPQRIAALIGIAAAPDFTEDLMWHALSEDQRRIVAAGGAVDVPGEYGNPPLRIGGHLVADGRACRVLGGPIPIACPVHLLHGQRDTSVPWQRSLALTERIVAEDVRITFIKDGDHRLSRPQDLALLCDTLDRVVAGSGPR